MAGVIEIGSRTRTLLAPPHVVWESLINPHQPIERPGLHLLDDEREPTVLDADQPSRVVSSSLWPSRPRDQVLLEVTATGSQAALRCTLLTPDEDHPRVFPAGSRKPSA